MRTCLDSLVKHNLGVHRTPAALQIEPVVTLPTLIGPRCAAPVARNSPASRIVGANHSRHPRYIATSVWRGWCTCTVDLDQVQFVVHAPISLTSTVGAAT